MPEADLDELQARVLALEVALKHAIKNAHKGSKSPDEYYDSIFNAVGAELESADPDESEAEARLRAKALEQCERLRQGLADLEKRPSNE